MGQAMLLLAAFAAGIFFSRQWQYKQGIFAGAALFTAAPFCGIAGAAAMGRNLTPLPRPSANARLVRHGIYAFIRHPLYMAVICGSLGWALLRASWPALVTAIALGLFFDAKARREERWLRDRFPEYASYQKAVSRFIPWIY